MIYSMTGFGRGTAVTDAMDVVVEIKSVNNRYCDVNIKMPKKLTVFEDAIKTAVKSRLHRGRIDVYVSVDERASEAYSIEPDYALLDAYVSAYRALEARYELSGAVNVDLLSRIPEAFSVLYEQREESEYWKAIEPALIEALDAHVLMRSMEGEALRKDILAKSEDVRSILKRIEAAAPEILTSYKARTKERIVAMLQEADATLDESRIANELAIYADRTDIEEEIVRIYSHLEQMKGLLSNEDGSQSVGRRLDFLVQELNREVNTIGSKSPDIDISNWVIELKSNIEQIREQIQNIE